MRHNQPDGWVTAWTGVREGRPTVELANAGPPVDATQLNELLKPFVRADANGNGNGRAHDGHGLGLGLSIVQAIADAHGARLSMIAPPEGGLRVSVAFPATDPGC